MFSKSKVRTLKRKYARLNRKIDKLKNRMDKLEDEREIAMNILQQIEYHVPLKDYYQR